MVLDRHSGQRPHPGAHNSDGLTVAGTCGIEVGTMNQIDAASPLGRLGPRAEIAAMSAFRTLDDSRNIFRRQLDETAHAPYLQPS
jgi:hypothetical protein